MSVKELGNEEILEHLKDNSIFRNKQLSVLIKLLNSLKESTTFAIDGSWGTGKTVFVKQLCMLADSSITDYGCNTLDEGAISKLRTDQKVFYFNAWEQDYIGDATSALLIKLIADSDPSLQFESMKRAAAMINLSAGIKNLSHDFICPDAQTSKDKLVAEAKKLVDKREAMNKFIDEVKGDKVRLIFVIDELDRCKPTFAVDLLEVIKHYFSRDDITFILATNINQLSHTVQKYYGFNFDGYGYLNKFIDYSMGLSKVDTDAYARGNLNWHLGNGANEAAQSVISYYDFSMREINAFHSSLILMTNFINRDGSWNNTQYPIQLIYVPLAMGLRVRSGNKYQKFVDGNGADELRKFLEKTKCRLDLADISATSSEVNQQQRDADAIDYLVTQYESLMNQSNERYGHENLRDFHDAISLIGSYTTIQEENRQ